MQSNNSVFSKSPSHSQIPSPYGSRGKSRAKRRRPQLHLDDVINRYAALELPSLGSDSSQIYEFIESVIGLKKNDVTIQMVADNFDLIRSGYSVNPTYEVLRSLLFFAGAQGMIELNASGLTALGYPDVEELLEDVAHIGPARTFTTRLFTIFQTQAIPPEQINLAIVDKFQLQGAIHKDNFLRGKFHFIKAWNKYANVKGLPALYYHSNRVVPYAAKLEELPELLKRDVVLALSTLASIKANRWSKCKGLGQDQITLTTSILLQFIGFLQTNDVDVKGRTLNEILTIESIEEFVEFCQARAKERERRRHQLTGVEDEPEYGYTELTIVWQLRVLAQHALDNKELADELWKLRMHYWDEAGGHPESRLAKHKKAHDLDLFFSIAHKLLIRSDGPSKQGFGRVHRALLRRDALLFCLLGLSGYRRKSLCSITLNGVTFDQPSEVSIKLPKRYTKNKKRDHWHVVPDTFIFLFDHYIKVERLILLNGKPSDKFFVDRNGRALSVVGLSDMFKQRCIETIGKEINVHQIRKSWFTEFIDWSNGDYLSASVTLDASIRTLERFYKEHRDGLRIVEKYDSARTDSAIKAQTIIRGEI